MTRTDGKCKVDAIEVGELSYIGIGSPTSLLSCKYAFANAETGQRFGAGNRNTDWSERTLGLLQSLLESMEQDILRDVFDEGVTTSGGIESELVPPADGIPTL